MNGLVVTVEVILVVAILLPFYRVVRGPTVFDRMVGVGVVGTKTVILVCLVGLQYERLEMFIDIAMAYAMLNFVGTLVVAKYLDLGRVEPR
ncbi:monovalent cation/H+ antiporter complex subunit F [Candidatus Binatia bacterium]|nr:monovalent cation/H+ antiporter complex subunit F [Candidatus Binatia bacterium]